MTQVTTEKLYQHRPKAQGITIRRLQFNPKAIRRHYFANSPVMSHLLTALSSTFPIGEQFFVHSVRNVRDQVKHTRHLMLHGAVMIIISTVFRHGWRVKMMM